jgi:hypothetical protein
MWIRTFVPAEQLDTEEAAQAYKDLSQVERAFRSMKIVDLDMRPIRHWTADRVRSHVFLCMLAYHVEWYLRDELAPLLFDGTGLAAARPERSSPAASTEPSDAAKAKKVTKQSADGHRVMCFADLIDHTGTLTRNAMRLSLRANRRFTLYSTPMPSGCSDSTPRVSSNRKSRAPISRIRSATCGIYVGVVGSTPC